jgi:hypothetical protein
LDRDRCSPAFLLHLAMEAVWSPRGILHVDARENIVPFGLLEDAAQVWAHNPASKARPIWVNFNEKFALPPVC